MPCTMTGSIEGDAAYYAKKSLAERGKELTKMTQFLCEAMTILENQGLGTEPGKKLRKWWRHHQRVDAERRAEKKRHAKRDARDKKRKKKRRRLVCEDCGAKNTKANPVEIGPDPYASERYGDDTNHLLCKKCQKKSAADL